MGDVPSVLRRAGLRLIVREDVAVLDIGQRFRDLFTQQPVGTSIWIALAWCVGILVVAFVFAMRTYRRKIS